MKAQAWRNPEQVTRPVGHARGVTVEHALLGDLLQLTARAEGSDPPDGVAYLWHSNGTGYGNAGDLVIASNQGGTVKKTVLFSFQQGA